MLHCPGSSPSIFTHWKRANTGERDGLETTRIHAAYLVPWVLPAFSHMMQYSQRVWEEPGDEGTHTSGLFHFLMMFFSPTVSSV